MSGLSSGHGGLETGLSSVSMQVADNTGMCMFTGVVLLLLNICLIPYDIVLRRCCENECGTRTLLMVRSHLLRSGAKATQRQPWKDLGRQAISCYEPHIRREEGKWEAFFGGL